ncbi:head GIN domain-containing protein [uncultured Draconibacterium sp.]|uniref:head GIN domain-containing protein n=1 Tax=uncultured Draconibacterium sp. TaxID=1573823 RepID=UPI003217FF65
MKTKVLFLSLFVLGLFVTNTVNAEEETRDVAAFSEISLNVPGKIYLEQGDKQSVRIVAKESTLEDIITEVKGRKLIIRFPNKNMFTRNFKPGAIDIYITVPEVDALGVSGSGDILAKELEARILNLAVSGSGNIDIEELDSEKVKGSISGSGNISIGKGSGAAEELSVSISGSGNFNAKNFEAEAVTVHTSGSGNCTVYSNGSVKARVAGSGNIYYNGNPSLDVSVAGSGKVRKM